MFKLAAGRHEHSCFNAHAYAGPQHTVLTWHVPAQHALAELLLRCLLVAIRAARSGWRNNPALPDGLVYGGMWGGEPQQLYGETGAQSTIVPAFDAVLGIKHQKGW